MADGERANVVADGKFLRFMKKGKWEFVTRKGVSGVVTIIATTEAGKLLLIEQFRNPVDARVIELPAGLAGDGKYRNETLETAARRELLEETGYQASEMIYAGGGPISPGMSDELITIFVAKNVHQVGPAEGDGDEQIVTHEVPINELSAWLAAKSQEGLLIDLKVYAAPYFLQQT